MLATANYFVRVDSVGCELAHEVDECTHLVIPALTLTLKAVNALLLQKVRAHTLRRCCLISTAKIIVSPQWLDELVMRTDVKSELPKPERYRKPISSA